MNVKNLLEKLDKEIEKLYEKLQTLDEDSKEYQMVEDAMIKLMDKKTEIEKLKGDKWSRISKILCDIAAILLPLGVTIWGTLLAFTFEERGTISSAIGKKFMDKLMFRK